MESAMKHDDFIMLALIGKACTAVRNRESQYVHMADTQSCQDTERGLDS